MSLPAFNFMIVFSKVSEMKKFLRYLIPWCPSWQLLFIECLGVDAFCTKDAVIGTATTTNLAPARLKSLGQLAHVTQALQGEERSCWHNRRYAQLPCPPSCLIHRPQRLGGDAARYVDAKVSVVLLVDVVHDVHSVLVSADVKAQPTVAPMEFLYASLMVTGACAGGSCWSSTWEDHSWCYYSFGSGW